MKCVNAKCQFFHIPVAIGMASAIMVGFSSSGHAAPVQTAQSIAQANCSKNADRSQPPFRCITPAIFNCLKANNASRAGSLEYRGGSNGTIVVKSNVAGPVALLGFQFNASSQTLDLSVKKRNLPVADQQIWDGFKDTISKCRQK